MENDTTRTLSIQKSTKNTLLVMASTLVSRLLGFIRIAVIGAVFGATGSADVLNSVFTIPNNLRKLMAEGALSSAFIPALSHALVQDGTGARSKKIVSNILTFQFIVLVPFCILCMIFAQPLMEHVLVDFSDPEQIDLSIRLFRWFINYLILISISAALMGTLNTHNSFFIPAITPILFSLAVISSILLLHKNFGVFSMVIGVMAGGLLQIIFQTPKFFKFGYSYKPNFRFNNPDFRKILRNWLPVVATASVFTINQQVAVRFATGLETGSASALSYALVFFQLPFGIFSASVTTVLFPRMSKQAGTGDTEGLRESIQYGIRFLIVTLVPSAFLLSILGKEIISVAMFRGQFTLEDTIRTSSVLTGYCIGLLSVGAFTFLQRYFYSVHNYRIPFIFSVVVAALDIGLSLWLKNTFLRVVGLAVANTIAFSIGFIFLLVLAGKRVNGLEGKNILLTLLKVCISTIPVIMFIYIFKYMAGDWWSTGSSIGGLFILLAEAAIAVGIIFGMYLLLKVEVFTKFILKGKENK